MASLESTLNLCTFCCKSVLHESEKDNNSSVQNFLKLLTRFVNDEGKELRSSLSLLPGIKLRVCKDCENLTSTFCEVYHNIKCLELQLLLKLETLMAVMKSAEKVPSRMALLQISSFKDFEKDKAAPFSNAVSQFHNLRNEIKNKCYRSKTLSLLQPRVLIPRLDQTRTNSSDINVEQLNDVQQILTVNLDIMIGWLLSFVAVTSLIPSSSSHDYFDNCNQVQNFQITDDDFNGFSLENVSTEPNTNMPQDNCLIRVVKAELSDETEQTKSNADLQVPDVNFYETSIILNEDDNGCRPNTPSAIVSETEESELDNISENQDLQKQPVNIDTQQTLKNDNQKKKPFTCARCKQTFTIERALKNHIKRRHRGILVPRRNIAKNSEQVKIIRFRCGVCKSTHTTYGGLRHHKRSFLHRYMEKKKIQTLKIEPKMENLERISNSTENLVESAASSFDSANGNTDIRNVAVSEHNTKPKRYNLRKSTKTSYASNLNLKEETHFDDQDQNSDADTKFVPNSDHSFSSDSDTTEEEEIDSDISESSHDDENDKDGNVTGKKGRFYYCCLDDCTFRKPFFPDELLLKDHQKLHQRGKFPCNFCDNVEDTVIKLSLHESKTHTTFPSTSTRSTRDKNIFDCARCAFETKVEGAYLKHFASVHIPIYDTNVGQVIQNCKICKRKLKTKHGAERHFKSHHDTSGLVDPEKQIRKCKIEGCSAYFLSSDQLWNHKQMEHLANSNIVHFTDEDDDIHVEEEEMETLKCSFCSKRFTSLKVLLQHKRTFHKRQIDVPPELKSESPNEYKPHLRRLICPEIKCTKRFQTKKGLKVHKNLHGIFSCNFCDEIFNYAPDVAYHEYEQHCNANQTESTEEPNPNLQYFKCPRCPKSVKNKLPFMYHFVSDHLGLSTIHAVCSLCKYEGHKETLHDHNLHCHNIKGMDPSKVPKCDSCPAYFRTTTQLIRHKDKMHWDPLSNKCLKCDQVFRSQRSLQMHMTDFHSKNNENSKATKSGYQCAMDRCKQNFATKHLLDRHQTLHERGNFPCHFCDEVFDTVLKLFTHETLRHVNSKTKYTAGTSLYCSRCTYSRNSIVLVQNHFAIVHTKTLQKNQNLNRFKGKSKLEFQCAICEFKVDSAPGLAIHETMHTTNEVPKGVRCPRCRKCFRKELYVSHFVKKHLDNGGKPKRKLKMYTCPICQAVTSRQTKHYSICHEISNLEDPSKIIKCGINDCKAYFLKGEQLMRHTVKMHKSEYLSCKECGKEFKNKTSWKAHVTASHPHLIDDENLELPLACDLQNCKKRFGTEAELQWHQRYDIHSNNLNGNAPIEFKCEKCNKQFAAKNRLQMHMSNIHSDKLFICPECGKSFKSKGALKLHSEYHKGPDSWKFQCATCGKKCVSKPKLNEHMRTHAKEKPFVCQYCGEKYAHRHNWKNHVVTKHKEEHDLPETKRTGNGNYVSRKGSKKGDCVIAGVKQ